MTDTWNKTAIIVGDRQHGSRAMLLVTNNFLLAKVKFATLTKAVYILTAL